jgi:hypothetical protein
MDYIAGTIIVSFGGFVVEGFFAEIMLFIEEIIPSLGFSI